MIPSFSTIPLARRSASTSLGVVNDVVIRRWISTMVACFGGRSEEQPWIGRIARPAGRSSMRAAASTMDVGA
ncbi:MAG: hypothetical protein R3F46_10125 [bacterium]